jgi:hypothetical protein
MRILFAGAALLAFSPISMPAAAAEPPFPRTGSAKLAAYTVCRSLGIIDMGTVGSQSSADCVGIVKSKEAAKTLDNHAIHCLEESRARADGYKFTGTCIETDADGDKIFMTYEGPESGPLSLIGGTGKYAGIEGSGTWTVTDAPGNSPAQFLFTLDYSVDWRFK